MKRGVRGARAALLSASLGLLACQGGPRGGRRPSAPPPGADPVPAWFRPAPPATAMAPVEPGFTHCCGSALYRIEIECGDMLKRCYENRGGRWQQTYGRHCREQLGEPCYLQDCDAKCQ